MLMKKIKESLKRGPSPLFFKWGNKFKVAFSWWIYALPTLRQSVLCGVHSTPVQGFWQWFNQKPIRAQFWVGDVAVYTFPVYQVIFCVAPELEERWKFGHISISSMCLELTAAMSHFSCLNISMFYDFFSWKLTLEPISTWFNDSMRYKYLTNKSLFQQILIHKNILSLLYNYLPVDFHTFAIASF